MPEEKSRINLLRETLQVDPDNAFVRYGLALELSKYGDPEEARQHFEYLLTHKPEYAATYYHAGVFFLNQGHREEARRIFTQGIEVTGRQGNLHAQSELLAALDQLIHSV